MKGGPVLKITPENRLRPALWGVGGVLLPEIFPKNPENMLKNFPEVFRKSGIICSVETSMNRSGSHPDHENRQIFFSTVLIRRGGAPSGAAVVIIFGGMGVSTPISNSRRPI